MDRRFRITVDGHPYTVTVEELADPPFSAAVAGLPPAPPPSTHPATAGPAAIAAPVPLPAPAADSADADRNSVCATLAGVVESVGVQVGQAVHAGQTVAVIEAMKMNSPMVSPRDGRVAAVLVKAGDAVEPGSVLLRLAPLA